MKKTENIDLLLPSAYDPADLLYPLNENMEKIDHFAGRTAMSISFLKAGSEVNGDDIVNIQREISNIKTNVNTLNKDVNAAQNDATNAILASQQAETAAEAAQATANSNTDSINDINKYNKNMSVIVKNLTTDVENAKSDADTAISEANTAVTKAQSAQDTADIASGNAETALAEVNTAKQTANTANSNATQAKKDALTAKSEASLANDTALIANSKADAANQKLDNIVKKRIIRKVTVSTSDNDNFSISAGSFTDQELTKSLIGNSVWINCLLYVQSLRTYTPITPNITINIDSGVVVWTPTPTNLQYSGEVDLAIDFLIIKSNTVSAETNTANLEQDQTDG